MRIQYAISLWNFSHYPSQQAEGSDLAGLGRELERIRNQGWGVELWGRWREIPNLYAPALRGPLLAALAGMPTSLHSRLVHSFAEQQAQVDAAHDLGARILVVHSDEFQRNEGRRLNVPLLRDLVSYAAERGVRIALENGQLAFLQDALAAVDGLKICLDIGHVYLVPEPLQGFLTSLGGYLVHLHLQDVLAPAEVNLPNAGRDHYLLGTGGIPSDDWALLVATLRQIDYDGMAVFELQPRTPYQMAGLGVDFFDGLLAAG